MQVLKSLKFHDCYYVLKMHIFSRYKPMIIFEGLGKSNYNINYHISRHIDFYSGIIANVILTVKDFSMAN